MGIKKRPHETKCVFSVCAARIHLCQTDCRTRPSVLQATNLASSSCANDHRAIATTSPTKNPTLPKIASPAHPTHLAACWELAAARIGAAVDDPDATAFVNQDFDRRPTLA